MNQEKRHHSFHFTSLYFLYSDFHIFYPQKSAAIQLNVKTFSLSQVFVCYFPYRRQSLLWSSAGTLLTTMSERKREGSVNQLVIHNGIILKRSPKESNEKKHGAAIACVIFLLSTFTFFTIFHVAQVNSTELSGCLHHILQFFMKNFPNEGNAQPLLLSSSTMHKFRRHLYSEKEVFMYSSVNSLIVCGTFCF